MNVDHVEKLAVLALYGIRGKRCKLETCLAKMEDLANALELPTPKRKPKHSVVALVQDEAFRLSVTDNLVSLDKTQDTPDIEISPYIMAKAYDELPTLEHTLLYAALLFTFPDLNDNALERLLPDMYRLVSSRYLPLCNLTNIQILIRGVVYRLLLTSNGSFLQQDGSALRSPILNVTERLLSFALSLNISVVHHSAPITHAVSCIALVLRMCPGYCENVDQVIIDAHELSFRWSRKSKMDIQLRSLDHVRKALSLFGENGRVCFDGSLWQISHLDDRLQMSISDSSPDHACTVFVEEKLADFASKFVKKIDKHTSASHEQVEKYEKECQLYIGNANMLAVALKETYETKLNYNCQKKHTAILTQLQNALDQIYPSYGIVKAFGSSVTGLYTNSSDLDVTIILRDSCETPHPEFGYKLFKMRNLAKVVKKAGLKSVELIEHARVPIVACVDPVRNVSVDINVGNVLGVYNSELLRDYVALDHRVRPMLMFVKTWSKKRDLNDPKVLRSINSYAYSLMVIAYLQHCNIVPSLQQGVLEPNIVEAIDPKYRRKCIKTINVNVGYNKPQVESQEMHTIWNGDYGVASLLIGFFFYYGYQHTYAPDSWVSVSAGGFVKGKPLWDNDFAQQLVVVDPFETDRNVCSAVEESLPVIINEFRRAYNFLSMNQFEEAFKEIRRSRNGNGRRRGALIVFKG